MPEVRQRTLNPSVSPAAVLFRHLQDQFLNLTGLSRATRTALAAAILLLSDEIPVPAQQGLWRNDCRHLAQQRPSQALGFGSQPTALIVIEPQPAFAQLFPQDTILLAQVLA